jgi:Kdo2-lipid IVA lauroyltransferase/acyltransferase
MSARVSIKHQVEYAFFSLVKMIARNIPRRAALLLGGHLGVFAGFCLPKRKKRAHSNMKLAFPHLGEAELHRNVREMFRHLGMSAMEMLRLDKLAQEEGLFHVHGLEHLREAYRLDRGVILLSGHIGFWEVGAFLLPRLGFPVDFVAKRMKNAKVDAYFTRMRQIAGCQCIDKRNGARKILQSLSQKRGVGVLLDQHASPPEGIPVKFLGRPAYTTPIITRLAMKHGIPVVPIFIFRKADNTYDFCIDPMILLNETDSSVAENTALLTSRIEKAIRREVTQWLWLHRRWRVDTSPAKNEEQPVRA